MPRNRIIPYPKDLKEKARWLQKNSTLSEVLLWQELKGKKILGFQFHRQVPMLDYIVDFYCHELMLVVEIDGISHTYENAQIKDKTRQERLQKEGVHFLRFEDLDVKKNMGFVLNSIHSWIQDNSNK